MYRPIIIIIFLLLTLLASLVLVFRTTIFLGRATGSSSSVAYGNSYLFSSPLQAKADGKEQIRVTVYLLDGRGLGVPNQTVGLSSSPKVTITSIQTTTDDTGKAVFDLSSSSPIKTIVSASNNQQIIPQTVKIVFY
ncbi:Ig-like domain-containing protein [Candidatus Shapirobacteria bacterium]|nr:Ig-like domain-containing protein [Candidatus Shapirobacteria bacterium]